MAGQELPPTPAGLVIGQERARGSYGTVHSGELDGSPVVVKKLHHVLLQARNNDKLMSDFYRECRILSTIRHANVVRFIGAYWDQVGKEPLLVMEAAKENLREFLERNKVHLGLEKQLAISSSMAEGLRFLHEREKPIVHRDLKPENVLVWEDGTVKIGDFGQSKLLGQPQSYMKTTQPGTVAYMPPEALKKKPSYTSKVDVFSLGVVMLEVCTQSPPSLSLVGIGVVPEVERHEDDLALLGDTHPLKPLIIWCLQDSHESRPDVKSTHAQVKLLEGGVKEANYQQRIRQLEVALKESREREMGLQTRLHRTVSELECTKAQVADLQIVAKKRHQEVRETKLQYEAELTHLRQTLEAWKATAERRDEECLSKVKELESLLSTRRCSATMQSAGELVSSVLSIPSMTSTTEKEAVGGEVGEKRASGNSKTPPSPRAKDLPTPVKCVECKTQLSVEEIQHCKEQGEALVHDTCRSAHLSHLQGDSEGQGLLDQASEDTQPSAEVVPEGPMCKLPGCPKQAQVKGKYYEFCSKGHYQMYDTMTPSPVSVKPSTSQRSPTSPTAPSHSGEGLSCQYPGCSEVHAVEGSGRILACCDVHHEEEERQLRQFQEGSGGQRDDNGQSVDNGGQRGDNGQSVDNGGQRGDSGQNSDSHQRGNGGDQRGDSGHQKGGNYGQNSDSHQRGEGGGQNSDSGGQNSDSHGQSSDNGGQSSDSHQRADGDDQRGDIGGQRGDSGHQKGDSGCWEGHSRYQTAGSGGQRSQHSAQGNYSGPGRRDKSSNGGGHPPAPTPRPKTCRYPGCQRPCYVEWDGRVHDFCGRTHADRYRAEQARSSRAAWSHHTEDESQGVLGWMAGKVSAIWGSSSHSTSASHDNHGKRGSSAIKFYHKHEPYYEFTNFYQASLRIDGKVWATSENYFQAQKYIGTPLYDAIQQSQTAREAFDISRTPGLGLQWRRCDWEAVKEDVMYVALYAKFTQHEQLTKMLLDTGDHKLIEHTTRDSYWGDGGDGSGQKRLGRLLIKLREELRKEIEATSPTSPTAPSHSGEGLSCQYPGCSEVRVEEDSGKLLVCCDVYHEEEERQGQGGGGSTGPRVHPHPPGHSPCRSCQEVYAADALGLCPRCHPRHRCMNAGCIRPAYFSPAFYAHGAFGYCSPDCRDKDLMDSGKAVQASMDSLSQLREHYRAALQRDMSRRGGSKVERGSGWQLRSSSTESTEMQVDENRMKASSPVGTRPLPTNELGKETGYSGTGTGRDDPAPKKAKRGKGEKYGGCEASGEERRASNVLQIDLSRQASKRLGLVFHRDQQHGLVVTGMDINIIYKNCRLRLLDVVTEVDGKPASVQQFENMRMDKKCSSNLTVIRNPLCTLSCADIDVKDWSGGRRKGPKPCAFLMAIQLLSSQRKAGTLDAILGVDLQDNRVVRLHERSVAAEHGVMEGDVIIGAGVLPVGKVGGKVPGHYWSSEEVAAHLAQTCDEGRVFACVVERLTDKE